MPRQSSGFSIMSNPCLEALESVKVIRHYQEIEEKFSEQDINNAWGELSPEQQVYINALVDGASPVPEYDVLKYRILDCETKEQLSAFKDEIKTDYGDETMNHLWQKILSEEDRKHLVAIASESGTKKVTAPVAPQSSGVPRKSRSSVAPIAPTASPVQPTNLPTALSTPATPALKIIPKIIIPVAPQTPASVEPAKLVNQPSFQSKDTLEHLISQLFDEDKSDAEKLEILQSIEAKTDSYKYVYDQLQIKLAGVEAEKRKADEIYGGKVGKVVNELERFKGYLKNLHEKGVIPNRLDGEKTYLTFTTIESISLKPGINPENLPSEYQRISENKSKLKQAWKNGVDISQVAEIHEGLRLNFYDK